MRFTFSFNNIIAIRLRHPINLNKALIYAVVLNPIAN